MATRKVQTPGVIEITPEPTIEPTANAVPDPTPEPTTAELLAVIEQLKKQVATGTQAPVATESPQTVAVLTEHGWTRKEI